jgi:hypothetical protein
LINDIDPDEGISDFKRRPLRCEAASWAAEIAAAAWGTQTGKSIADPQQAASQSRVQGPSGEFKAAEKNGEPWGGRAGREFGSAGLAWRFGRVCLATVLFAGKLTDDEILRQRADGTVGIGLDAML